MKHIKRKIAIIILGSFLLSVLIYFNILRQNYVVPILMYHSVSPQASRKTMLVVSPETFERQIRFLKQHNYKVVPVEKIANLIKNKEKIPFGTIAITFDDGFKDNYTYAFPVLKKYKIPATIFVIVNEVGRPQGDRVSWDEIKEMQDSGLVVIGSHALGPEPLVKINSQEQVRREIFESKRVLEEKLGKKINIFCYPEGMFNPVIRQLVIDAGYLGSVATNPGRNYPDDDIFALKRLRISENAKSMFVFGVEASGFYTYMKESKRKHKK
ncbi:MAG: polysaccharide deacetylase family protein [Candidatus Omnitrophica bacterium]|nr:polysaccharide deacetylase family protein [Candidatus Omnitrophota bacterium]